MQSAPVDHALEAARNRILALVHRWMSVWDANHGDAAPLLDLLSPEGFELHTTTQPDPITTIAGTQAWFSTFPTKVARDNHVVEDVQIRRLGSGDDLWGVTIRVYAPGTTVDGTAFVVRSQHTWEVVDYGGAVPRIRRLEAHLVRES